MRTIRLWLQGIMICVAFVVVLTNATWTLSGGLAVKWETIDYHVATTNSLNRMDNQGIPPSNTFAVNAYSIIKGNQPLERKSPNYTGGKWANLTWDKLTWDKQTWNNLTWDSIQSSTEWDSAVDWTS
jgi:hypothetical protein